MTELRELLGPIHLRCEAARLRQPDLRWDNYLEIALARALGQSPLSPRAWLRKARNFFQSPPPVGAAPWPVRIGWRCCGWRGLLPLFFPVIAFRLDHPRPLAWTRSPLNAPGGGFAALRATYLEQWGRCYEVNFRFGRRAAPAEPRPTESL